MQPCCSSPDEFLRYVRFVHENPIAAIQSEPNQAFQQIHDAKRMKLTREEAGTNVTADSAHEHIAGELWRSLQESLPPAVLHGQRRRIAVGALDNISVNALCAKSSEGHIAVVINSGLMTLLNKLSKIQVASVNPDSITYCNRAEPNLITAKMLREWNLEVCEHYRRTGKPLGPQIHLEGDAEVRHAAQLNLWEMFVLCHEIGHVLCSHLESKQFLSSNPVLGMIETLEGNKHREMEAEADLVGYLLLREYANETLFRNQKVSGDDRGLLVYMVTFFNLLFLLGASESASHPHPLDRLCNIVSSIYGEDIADIMAGSYENHDLLSGVFKRPLHARRLLKEILENVG